jgi:hypothetical protein
MHTAITRRLQAPDMKQRFVAERPDAGNTQQQFQAFIKSDIECRVALQVSWMRTVGVALILPC